MPLHIADLSTPQPWSLKTFPAEYLIFYSSVVDGEMWCPDCRAVEDQVQQTFGAADGPSGLIIYVGNREEWKRQDKINVFRDEPWKVQSVPTIIKLKEADEVGRLVDNFAGSLASFVK